MTNCPNCGAPIQSDICEYCGTVFNRPSGIAISAEYTPETVSKLLENGVMTVNEARQRLEARTDYLKAIQRREELFAEAIKAMRSYGLSDI